MRRNDRAGKGLCLTANDTQIETGSSTPFYMLDPIECNYTTENTRWRYLWTASYQLDLTMEMYYLWVPKPTTTNDRNIMDIAMKDDQLRNSRWPMLQHINTCRIYLRAVFISDLSLDSIKVHEPFLKGLQRNNRQSINFPDTKCPTKNQWRLWESFIFRNFLSPGTIINPALGTIQCDQDNPRLPVSEVDLMTSVLDEDKSIEEMLQALPSSLRTFVGQVEIPNDGGLSISEAIVGGDLCRSKRRIINKTL